MQPMALQFSAVRGACLKGDEQHNEVGKIAGRVIPEQRVIRDF